MGERSDWARDMMGAVNGYTSSLIGFFLGFAFGVGCALAVMYSIYMGGYRAAVKESLLAEPPERMVQARAAAARELAESVRTKG